MSKSLINIGKDITDKFEMLNELLTKEWESEEEKEIFAAEIVKSIVGDESSFVQKISNIQEFLARVEFDKERAAEWVKDIERQKKIATNMQKRVKEYALYVLKHVCEKMGSKAVDNGTIRISYQNQGIKEPVDVFDETLIPYKFFNHDITFYVSDSEKEKAIDALKSVNILPHKIEKWPDKDRIREAIKSGEKVEGAKILPQDEGIRIKNILPKVKW